MYIQIIYITRPHKSEGPLVCAMAKAQSLKASVRAEDEGDEALREADLFRSAAKHACFHELVVFDGY